MALNQSFNTGHKIKPPDELPSQKWRQANLALCILIIFANAMALVVFLKKSFLVKKSTYLLVSLTIADLLVGAATGFSNVCSITMTCNLSMNTNAGNVSVIAVTFSVVARSASIFTLTSISIERAIAVFWPFHHRLAKRWHYFTTIAFTWLLAIARGATFTIYDYFVDSGTKVSMAFMSITIAVSLVAILASYFTIWIKLKFFTKFRQSRTIQENSKLTKTLFVVTLVSVVTFSPLLITDAALAFGENPHVFSSPIVFPIVFTLLTSNSVLNIAVYLFRMPEFRKELRNVFRM